MDMSRLNCRTGLSYPDQFSRSATAIHATGEIQTTRRILHDCGSLDPWLKHTTRVVEKQCKELGGKITVLVTEGGGHFPVSRKDPKPVVDFIVSHR